MMEGGQEVRKRMLNDCSWTSIPFVKAREKCIAVSELGDIAVSVLPDWIDSYLEGAGKLYTFLRCIECHR